jgi:galactokinase
LVPKDEKGKENGLNIPKPVHKNKRSQSITKSELIYKTEQLNIRNEEISKMDPESQKYILRAEEAERAIKEMEANKGKMNYYRISEKELAEVASIDSSNVDYVEIFEERISKLEEEIENTHKRVNGVIEIINKTDKTLREVNKQSVSELQEYVYTLHKEMDDLVEKTSNKSSVIFSEETLKKLVK